MLSLLESLRNYDPWGRAGGGAPTSEVRRRDLLSRYIYPQNHQLSRDCREQPLLGLRPRQRPRRTFLTTDLKRPREALNDPPDIANYEQYERQRQEDEAARKFPHVWSSEPWDGRGPWGGRGPGGRPWRPAGHVGRNFHHSMGWTTGETFHFPSIDKENLGNVDQTKKAVKIGEPMVDDDEPKKSKMPPITNKNINNNNNNNNNRSSTGYERGFDRVEYLQRKENIDGRNHRNDISWDRKHRVGFDQNVQRRAGGTPTRQLLQMTGGIELVPLMRARAWTFRQAVPHENFSSQFSNQLKKYKGSK